MKEQASSWAWERQAEGEGEADFSAEQGAWHLIPRPGDHDLDEGICFTHWATKAPQEETI